MSFLRYQKQSPELLNNYLNYKAFIEFKSKTTKKFFEYLEVNNFISINPARNMKSGRVKKRIKLNRK